MKSTSLLIALRYLFGKKSHSAVNAIAYVSVAGVAVATAAVVCVLSVFNGFQSVLAGRLDQMSPDLMVTPRQGKTIPDGDSLALELGKVKGVAVATPTLTDNALGFYSGRETPVTLKGIIPQEYARVTNLDSLRIGGGEGLKALVSDGEQTSGCVSIGAAYKLGLFEIGAPLMVFAPKRLGRFNPANPAAAFVMDSLYVADIFQSLQEAYDENTIFTDISFVRDLLLYDSEATAIEIKTAPGADVSAVLHAVAEKAGAKYVVKDRLMQQEINFRMVKIEKWMTFLLLFFILVIASFNIISTLSILVLEKQDNLQTLAALGMSRPRIASVFRWESLLVSAIGGAAGLLLGSALCLLQQHFGFITIANGSVDGTDLPYPVALQASDILITLVPLTAIACVCAAIAASFAKSRIK